MLCCFFSHVSRIVIAIWLSYHACIWTFNHNITPGFWRLTLVSGAAPGLTKFAFTFFFRPSPFSFRQVDHHGTEEARTCEAWFQLTFRSQKWNLKAHMWYQLSLFPRSNAAIAMQHHPGNIHQSVATPRYSATPWYVLIQLPNAIDTISKRWRSKRAFNTSPSHIFP